jgi:hypothetical protein
VTIRLPEPSQSEGNGLASDLTHAQSLSGGDTERVTVEPGYPTPTQCSCRRWRIGVAGIPECRMPEPRAIPGQDPVQDRHFCVRRAVGLGSLDPGCKSSDAATLAKGEIAMSQPVPQSEGAPVHDAVSHPRLAHFLAFMAVGLAVEFTYGIVLIWLVPLTGYRRRDLLLVLVPFFNLVMVARWAWRYSASTVYWSTRDDWPSAVMPERLRKASQIGGVVAIVLLVLFLLAGGFTSG